MKLERDIRQWLAQPATPERDPNAGRKGSARSSRGRAPKAAAPRRARIEAGISSAFVTELDVARKALNDAAREPRIVAARGVLGSRVFDAAGKKAGRIVDLSIDKETGRIVYALIGVDGGLGFLKRLYPAHWRLLHHDTSLGGYVMPAEAAAAAGHARLTHEQLRALGVGDEGWQERLVLANSPFLAFPLF